MRTSEYNDWLMDEEALGGYPEGGRARPRPKVVDKRVSARPEGAAPPPPPPPAPATESPAAERTVGPAAEPDAAPTEPTHDATSAAASAGAPRDVWTPEQEAQARQVAREIAETPSYEWVVNTAVTLANVAGTKVDLGAAADAGLAIDALAGILDALGPRLQQAEAPLRQTLAQLRLAYAERVAPPPATG